ncbi:Holliday junction resolvase RuvX [Halocola ammonii]
MGKILAIDYGKKRVGIAESDETKTFAFGLDTVENQMIFKFLKKYLQENDVETIVVGEPTRLNGEPTHITEEANEFCDKLRKKFPSINVDREDESFTSKLAFDAMIKGGLKKKDRRNKAMVDKVSATLILQSYLENI